jgi:tetratricopeptide (TPR) repeat protein
MVLDLLGNLIDRSLVAVVRDEDPAAPGEPRYTLLESMRDYARAHLEASGERAAVSRRHAEFFATVAQRQAGLGVADLSAAHRAALRADHANLRACLDWTTAQDLALAMRLAEALMPYWRLEGHHVEALQRGEAILSAGGSEPLPGRRHLLIGLCALAFERGLIEPLRSFARRAACDSRAAADRRLEAKAASWEGHSFHFDGDLPGALQCYERTLSIARDLDDRIMIGEALGNIGTTQNALGDAAGAVARLSEAFGIFRAANFHWGLGFVAESLGEVSYAQGEFAAARVHWIESVAQHRVLGHPYRIVTSLQRLGSAEHRLGRLAAARATPTALSFIASTVSRPWRASSLRAAMRGVRRGCSAPYGTRSMS